MLELGGKIKRKAFIKKRKLGKAVILLLIVLMILLLYAFIEPYCIRIKEVDVTNKDIPVSFEDTKILFAADIHHGPFFSKERVKSLVSRINRLHPNIVLLGGDYVQKSPQYIKPCFEEFKNINADIKMYGVLGNHDHWEGSELTRQSMKDAGIKVLDNKSEWINKNNERIKIGGVGDLYEDTQDINPTIHDVGEDDFVVLLSHNPDYVERINTKKIDLVLSGHTHGGQVTLFGLWAPLIPSIYGQKYRTGFVKTDYTEVLVTNGVGTVTPPVRFFARPEVVLIHLRTGKKI